MYNPMALENRRILITGASSGIGRACAVMASKLGASCVLVARNEKALRETQLLMNDPEKHDITPCDLTKLVEIKELFDTVTRTAKLTGLVHASGVCSAGPIAYQSIEEMEYAMTLNFYSFIEMAKYISKKKYFEKGSVVAVSSISASVGWRGVAIYSATKGALSASVRSLAMEFVDKGIRVNAVQPSHIMTPMFNAVAGDINPEKSRAELAIKQPLGIGEPEDVAAAVCFLLSDAARFITGTHLVVDGGYLAQ